MAVLPVQLTMDSLSQTISLAEVQTATFSIAASGSGSLTYQWVTDDPNISSGGRFQFASPIPLFISEAGYNEPLGVILGATNPTYTTPTLSLSDTGYRFTCYVTQVVIVPKSVGGLNLTNQPPQSNFQSFSFAISSPAILTVTP